MKKNLFLLMPLFFATSVFAQDSDWLEFSSEECNFSILLPEKPTVNSQDIENQGRAIRSVTFDSQDGMTLYSINCSNDPAIAFLNTKDQTLTALKDFANSQLRGVPPEDITEVSLNDYVGISYIERFGDSAIIYTRLYIAGNKLYNLNVGDLEGTAQKGAESFFESFRVP